METESDSSNFAFAFDNAYFSNRLLKIEIMPKTSSGFEVHGYSCTAKKFFSGLLSSGTHSPDHVRIINLRVNSAILAGQSKYFRDLFSKQQQYAVTLQISECEEEGFMMLLDFMYGKSLSHIITYKRLLNLLLVAKKFDVVPCVKYYCKRMRNVMTPKTLGLYFLVNAFDDLRVEEEVQLLFNETLNYIRREYRVLRDNREHVISLPLAGIKALFSSDDVDVFSEDEVCDFVIEWLRTRYPSLEERRKVLRHDLGSLIRYQFMSNRKLKEILSSCDEFDPEFAKDVVLKALFDKQSRCSSSSSDLTMTERAYRERPIKTLEFDSPHKSCIVYLELEQKDFAMLSRKGKFIYTQPFHLGMETLLRMFVSSTDGIFMLGIYVIKKESEIVKCKCDVAVREKPSAKYRQWPGGVYEFTEVHQAFALNQDLLQMPWPPDEANEFIENSCPYLINGILYIRVELILS